MRIAGGYEGPVEQRHPREPAGKKCFVHIAVEPCLDIGDAGNDRPARKRRTALLLVFPVKQAALDNRAEVLR